MSGVFNIGLSGLNAARSALEVTSHNISNVNTEGYSRQRLSQTAEDPQFVGYGYIGRGVDVTSVSRIHDNFIERQLQSVNSAVSGFQTQATALNDIDNLITDGNAGISTVLQDYYSSLQTLSQQPTSISARQAVLSQAESLAGRFQSVGDRLDGIRQGLITQVKISVDAVNAYAGQIASLNEQILSLNQGGGRLPNDLLDQRETLLQNLNKLIKTDKVEQSDGTYSVFIGQGHPLVLGPTSYDMVMNQGAPVQPEDPEAPSVSIRIPGSGNLVTVDSALAGGGVISGAMTTLSTDMARVQADIGRMAIEFSDAMNRQHELGVDLNGVPATGGVFNDLSAERTAAETATTTAGQSKALRDALAKFGVALQDPAKLGMSSGLQAGVAPAGNPRILSVWQVASLYPATNAPFAGAINLNYDPTISPPFTADDGVSTYTVTQSPNQSNVLQFTLGGGEVISFRFEGSNPAAQSIPVTPRTLPVTKLSQLDNFNLLEMTRLQSLPLMAATPNSSTTFMPAIGAARTATTQSFYGQAASYIGSKANVAQVNLAAKESAMQEIKLSRESFSGVNLDEEAANLIRFQQAFQASSKVLQTAQEMFRSLLDLGR